MAVVRALERGLEVLSALCERGTANASEIAQITGIPRPTVHRLLVTLCEAGYVSRNASAGGFHITLQTRRLSGACQQDMWLRDVAGPILHELGSEVLWPCNLATFFGDAMIVQESTHPVSPFSTRSGMIGSKWSMTKSIFGRTYLAFCPEREFDELMLTLPNLDDKVRRATRVDRQNVAGNGYAWNCDFKIHSLAVPIRAADRVLGVLHMVWFKVALTREVGLQRFLPRLLHFAGHIEAALDSEAHRFTEMPRAGAGGRMPG